MDIHNIPKWAWLLALLVLLTGVGFWIAASRRRLKNEATASQLLAQGKMQATLAEKDIEAIAAILLEKKGQQ